MFSQLRSFLSKTLKTCTIPINELKTVGVFFEMEINKTKVYSIRKETLFLLYSSPIGL